MPRNRRPGKGHRYSSGGGGGLDLGGLLSDIGLIGNVEADPSFAAGGEIGPLPAGVNDKNPAMQSKSPYRAKDIFAKGRANAMNTEFAGEQIARTQGLMDEKDMARFNAELGLETEQKALPIKEQWQKILSGIQSRAAIEQNQKQAMFDVLKQRGMIPTDANIGAYDTRTFLKALGAAESDFTANDEGNRLRGEKAALESDLLNQNRGLTMQTGAESAALGLGQVQNERALLPHNLAAKRSELANTPRLMDAKIDSLKPTLGYGAFTLDGQQITPDKPNPDIELMERIKARQSGLPTPATSGNTPGMPPARMTPPGMEHIAVNPETGEMIDKRTGKKVTIQY